MQVSWRRAVALGWAVPFILACSVQACTSEDDPAPISPAAQLERETGSPWIVDEDPESGTPDLMLALDPIAPTAVNGVSHERAARDFIAAHKDMFKLRDPEKQLLLDEVILSHDKTAHVRFLQREGGLLVDGAMLAVHFRADGSIAVLNGSVAPDAAKAIATPVVTAAGAISAAEAAVRASRPDYVSQWLTETPVPRLVLAARGAGAVLAWRLELDARGPAEPFGLGFLVDARTGAIVGTWSTHADERTSGTGFKGDQKTFAVTKTLVVAGDYEMSGFFGFISKVTTRDANQGNAVVRSSKVDEWDRVEVGAGAAVDAHTYVSDTDSYFRRYHGWASPTGRGTTIEVYAHDNSLKNNAWWDGKALHFSDGDVHTGGQKMPRSTGPDTVGHEFMHGVTQHTSGLKYRGQSGALNESLSDIFGSYVEAEIHPGSPFEHGDQSGPVLRDLAHPKAKGQPDHMTVMRYPNEEPTKDNDWAGVHYNSGIPNNAWYLMSVGGTNDTSGITVSESIGLDSARGLWWATARYFLGSGSQFDRAARWQTAWAWVTRRPIAAVGCAWVATGVIEHDYVKKNYKVQCFCELPDGGMQKPEAMQCCTQSTSKAKGKSTANDVCCKPCDDAGVADAGGGAPSEPTESAAEPDLFDSCKGRVDGVYCSQLASYSAIVCKNEAISLGIQCGDLSKCIGPNGPGTDVQCEGSRAPSSEASGGAAPPPQPDSCEGRANGIYCSVSAPYSAYECNGGQVFGGHYCAGETKCTGPNGPGKSIVCK